jgi:SAM-dependent methyltransferase
VAHNGPVVGHTPAISQDHGLCSTTAGLLPTETRGPQCIDQPTVRNTTRSNPPRTPVPFSSVNSVDDGAGVARRPVGTDDNRRASRGWWDRDADHYQARHGDFLGDADFVWCPEGLREADARLLGKVAGRRVLEVGCGAASVARWLSGQGAEVVAADLSAGMLRHARLADDHLGTRTRLVHCDAMALPFASESFDLACTAFGAVPFVDDSARVMREVCRVLRPGGRWAFSVAHPIEWVGSCQSRIRGHRPPATALVCVRPEWAICDRRRGYPSCPDRVRAATFGRRADRYRARHETGCGPSEDRAR